MKQNVHKHKKETNFKRVCRRNIFHSTIIFVTLAVLASCKSVTAVPTPSKGNMDPTTYVSVGNSITSGYADGALYYDGQLVSYPNLIAQQFKLAGGGDFKQPLMDPSSVGVGSAGNAPYKLDYATDCLGISSLAPVLKATTGDTAAFSNNVYAAQGPFNNMGVPGAKVITAAISGYGNPSNGAGNYNPFFTRMAKDITNSSMLSDALLLKPTFFSLFLGNNDVLLYATNGGASDFITPQSNFDVAYQLIVDSLTKNGAKGVLANLPDITALPYFTTVPWDGLTLTRQGQADTLNALWTPVGGNYNFHVGNNAFLIKDPTAPLGQRQITEGEYILLDVPLNNVKCYGLGSLQAIPNQYVLTASEISSIRAAIANYNATIKSIAQQKGLAFVDVNAFMQQAVKGISYNGMIVNALFAQGGAFSLDGIHLTPLGNALLANEFIKSINTTYGSTIPQVDATKYHGTLFP